MTAMRLQFSEFDVLEALERSISCLDESASMLTLNDRLLDLLLDELLPEDDPARVYKLEPWLVLLDVTTPAAYELAMVIDDKDQAGHGWHSMSEQLAKLHYLKLESSLCEGRQP
jgi:hypothetical protein